MHQPVKDNLEEYLRGVGGKFVKRVPPEMESHLDSCGECAAELDRLQSQALAVRAAFRASGELEPRSGFYARVMQRIEDARASNSVWAAFLDPVFARRLVYLSATLVLLFGAYLVSTTPAGNLTQMPPAVSVSTASTTASADDFATPQERDAVLVNLAAYQE